MKRLIVTTPLILFTLIFAVSCKKENATPAPSVVGFWKGKLGIGQQYPVKGYAFLFRNNGTVRVFALGNLPDTLFAYKAEGTYSMGGDQVHTTYNFLNLPVQHSTTATIKVNYTFIEGTWGQNMNPTNGGKFFLHRQ